MRNLARNTEADIWCAAELTAAGIEIVPLPAPLGNEVRTRVTGKIGEIKFERAWYYWVAVGEVPIEIARKMYADPIGAKEVRVAGHCDCPSPDEWYEGGPVMSYHIDSAEGLALFARMLKPNP